MKIIRKAAALVLLVLPFCLAGCKELPPAAVRGIVVPSDALRFILAPYDGPLCSVLAEPQCPPPRWADRTCNRKWSHYPHPRPCY